MCSCVKVKFNFYNTLLLLQLLLLLLMKSVDFDNESDDLSEEENVPIGKLEFWQITVHVHGKEVNVSCGDATQRLKWLAHVAIGELNRIVAFL